MTTAGVRVIVWFDGAGWISDVVRCGDFWHGLHDGCFGPPRHQVCPGCGSKWKSLRHLVPRSGWQVLLRRRAARLLVGGGEATS